MRTFWIRTSWPYACTPSTAVKIHPANTQAPIQPHVNPHNIPKLIPFNHSVTHLIYPWTQHTISQMVQCNTANQQQAILLLICSSLLAYNDTIYKRTETIPLHPQPNKYYKCTYSVCGTRLKIKSKTNLVLGRKKDWLAMAVS